MGDSLKILTLLDSVLIGVCASVGNRPEFHSRSLVL